MSNKTIWKPCPYLTERNENNEWINICPNCGAKQGLKGFTDTFEIRGSFPELRPYHDKGLRLGGVANKYFSFCRYCNILRLKKYIDMKDNKSGGINCKIKTFMGMPTAAVDEVIKREKLERGYLDGDPVVYATVGGSGGWTQGALL